MVKYYRQMGYKIRVSHFRPDPVSGKLVRYSRKTKGVNVLNYGGYTEVEIRDTNGNEYIGKSECSLHDSFSYSIGTTIALGRALNKIKK